MVGSYDPFLLVFEAYFQVLLLLVSGREKKSQLEATKPFKIRVIYQSQQKSPEEVPGRGFTSELCQVRLQVGGT